MLLADLAVENSGRTKIDVTTTKLRNNRDIPNPLPEVPSSKYLSQNITNDGRLNNRSYSNHRWSSNINELEVNPASGDTELSTDSNDEHGSDEENAGLEQKIQEVLNDAYRSTSYDNSIPKYHRKIPPNFDNALMTFSNTNENIITRFDENIMTKFDEKILSTDAVLVARGVDYDSPMSGCNICSLTDEEEEDDDIRSLRLSMTLDKIDGHDIVRDSNSDDSYNVRPKPCRTVTFRDELVTEVREFERCKEEDKQKLFYTSKDMQSFRLRYIWELQEQQETCGIKEKKFSAMFKKATANFTDFVLCKSNLGLC